MNPIIKEHLVSALQTFLSTFLLALGTGLTGEPIQWTTGFWLALVVAAARAAVKEVFARFAPVSLGGRK